MPGFTDYVEDNTGSTQNALGWTVLALLGINCAINIVIQIKDQYKKLRILYFKFKSCSFLTKKNRVKMMSETYIVENMTQTSNSNKLSRKSSETGITKMKEIEMVPIALIPTHESQFAKGIGLESLQLFTPRGKNLLDRNTPLDLLSRDKN